MFSDLTIQLVTWNSARDLPTALIALKEIPAGEVHYRVIDNASTDESVALVRDALPMADIIELPENRGFGGAHNIGFDRCKTSLVFVHNPDLAVVWEGLRQLLVEFKDEKLGAVQGKLLRPGTGKQQRAVFDSTGIVHTLTLNGRERGAGELDTGQYEDRSDLLAVTGAAGLYRLSALRTVQHSPGEYFDADFFAYKEDVDLGWRLCNAGWRVTYVPVTLGTHARHVRREGVFNWGLNPLRVYRRLQSRRTQYSLRNWVWMVFKNASLKQLLLRGIFIDLRILLFVSFGLLYPPLLAVWIETARGLPKMARKRRRQKNLAA